MAGSPDSRALSEAGSAPFLTVVVRTQGRRLITLEDNLTSLAAQTNRDMEVIVCCHGTSEAQYVEVTGVISRLPAWLGRNHPGDQSGRRGPGSPACRRESRPRGVATWPFLDDDDLAFCHWVDEFAQLVELHPGAVVRAGCATHSIDEEPWDCGVGYRQTGPTQTLYPLVVRSLGPHGRKQHPELLRGHSEELLYRSRGVVRRRLAGSRGLGRFVAGLLCCAVSPAPRR